MDRRAVFFVIAAVVSLALVPAIPHEAGKPSITWVGWTMVVAFLLLAVLSWLDHRSRHRERP
ncbi:MAG: hypothetical protein R2694_19495 [Ilumatobacteraceae bacterium]|nr:hypothetical protein [Ilumatobacter sp.]